MLFPQNNASRQTTELGGFWQVIFDPENRGDAGQYGAHGFEGGQPVAVCASLNEQFEDKRDYLGTAWYKTTFGLPWGWRGQRVFVRFGAVSYLAQVWLNGVCLGEHEGGHLPFVFDITDVVKDADNLLVVRVNGDLAPERVPPGGLNARPGTGFGRVDYPDTNYDFFPYYGIERPVSLYTTPQRAIRDLTVTTTIEGTSGVVAVRVERNEASPLSVRAQVIGHGADVEAFADSAGPTSISLSVPNAALWSPATPTLYQLQVELRDGATIIDQYTLRIGIRTIAVEGDKLLLNGEPLVLRGFGRHEDFAVVGKGMLPALIVKDYALLRWVGANSYRTTHYPYSDEMMDLADELGFLVIDETPAVGLFFTEPGLERRNAVATQLLRELIIRDKNHPSVIMWSLANEPHTARPEARQAYQRGEMVPSPSHPAAVQAFRAMADVARELDPSRLVTLVSHEGAIEESFAFLDVVALNRYFGWYTQSGRIEAGIELLEREIELMHSLYPKPFMLTEFGVDTIPGHHAEPPEMFSEEYQVEFLSRYIAVLDNKPFVAGQHIWNLCDFKTGQGIVRTGAYNYKGIFTRDRRPKMAAHAIRALWFKGAK